MKRGIALAALVAATIATTASAQLLVPELVADACPGACYGLRIDLQRSAVDGDTLYFATWDYAAARLQVSATNGTPGTTRLVTDPAFRLVQADFIWGAGGTLFIAGWELMGQQTQFGVWRSGGPSPRTNGVTFLPAPTGPYPVFRSFVGTSLGVLAYHLGALWWIGVDEGAPVRLLGQESALQAAVESGGAIYFAAGGTIGQPLQLYRFIPPGNLTPLGAATSSLDSKITLAAVSNGIVAIPQSRNSLWFSDGSGQAKSVFQCPPGAVIADDIVVHGGKLHFVVEKYGYPPTGGWEYSNVWVSDGTGAGTRQLTSFATSPMRVASLLGPAGSDIAISIFSRSPDRIYADVPTSPLEAGTWVLDERAPLGARPIHAVQVGSRNFYAFDTQAVQGPGLSFIWEAGHERLWASDGTSGGTRAIAEVDLSSTMYGQTSDSIYFPATHPQAGRELHRIQRSQLPMSRPTVTVVEYHHAGFDHYFMTADPVEQARLDAGSLSGWARTGFAFIAYAAGSGLPGTSPVCRFYGRPEAGLDSHFFSASIQECSDVESRFSASWQKESANVFEAQLPDPVTGLCPATLATLFRAFNGRRDANHRYTLHAIDQQQMQARGWTPEGSTSGGIAMCVLAQIRP